MIVGVSNLRSPRATNSEASRNSDLANTGADKLYIAAPMNLNRIPGASERFDQNSEPRQIHARTNGLSFDHGGHKAFPAGQRRAE